jgi:hypothetical protein
MSRLPDFSSIGFEPTSAATGSASGQSWTTPEGIDVKQAYGPADVAGLDFLNTWPGAAPFLRGPYPAMYATLDHPPVCRFLDRRSVECLLPAQPCRRPEGPFGRFRSGDPPRL